MSHKPLLILLAITFYMSMHSAFAQDSVTVVRYAINKDWVKMIEGVDYLSSQEKERARYLYGGRSSYTAYTRLFFNDSVSMYSDVFDDEESYGYSWLKDPYLIRRNFERMQIHDVMVWMRKVVIVEDSLEMPKWKILNDVREIAGQICMNASWTDTLRGQTYVAWFALSVPSRAGPERLCGLPGLILGVEVNNGAMEIMAQSIDTVPLTDQLEMPARFDGRKIKGKHISEELYQIMVQKHMAAKRKAQEYPFWGIRY
ncbi:MAG: GLPGLI family protein [Bacteroidales bacterium]